MTFDPNQPVQDSLTNRAPDVAAQDSLSGANAGMINDQNTARRLNLIKNTAPIFGATPDGIRTAMQMAQSAWDDQTLVTNVKNAAAQTIVSSIKDQIDAQTDGLHKWKMWQGLDETQKKLLQQSGFTPPEQYDDPGDTSVLGVTKGIIGGLVKDITGNPITKPIFGEIGKGLDQVQHLAEAGILGVQEEGFFGIGGSLSDQEIARRHQLGNIGSDFLNLWDRTGNGEKVFNVKAYDRVHLAIPDADKFNFVQSLASGDSIGDYLTKSLKMDKSDPNFTTQYLKYSQYTTDKSVQDAVTDLKNNHISPGRFIAGAVAKRGSTAFNILSGGIDATFDIVGDPFLWATEGLGDYRIAKTGLGAADGKLLAKDGFLATRVDQLRNVPKFDRAAGLIADAFNTDKTVNLMDQMPAVRQGLPSMATYFFDNGITDVTKEHVFDYFKSEAAKSSLLAGEWSVPHYPGLTLPSFSRVQEAKSIIGLGVKASIDNFRLADYGLDSLSPEQLSQLFPGRMLGVGPKWTTAAQAQNGIGEFLKGMVTKVPHQNWMNPMDEKAPQVFRSMMDYVLPKDMQNNFMSDFLGAQSFEGRRAVYQSAVDAMWHYSGAYGTDAGKDIYRQITQMDQVYGADGIDLLNGSPAGILPSDHANGWAIPTFKNMLEATKDTTSVRKYLDETNDGIISKFMNHWRPQVLLKVGFVPRAYGEELLSFISREGLTHYVQSRAALSATSPDEWLLTRPVHWVADSLMDHIPVVGDHVAMVAHNMASYANEYFKNFAEKLAPEEYLRNARTIAARDGMNSLSRELGTYHGAAAQDLGETARREQIQVKSANGDIRTENIRFGDIDTHMRGDYGYHHTVYREMRRLAEDPVAQPVLDAMRRRIEPERGDQLVQMMKDQQFLPELEPHIGPNGEEIPRKDFNYGQGLLRARQWVPDQVMPKFEQYMKNPAQVSSKAVTQELVENGMDAGQAENLIDVLTFMTPRERISVFTRDGSLERMLQAKTLDPNAVFDMSNVEIKEPAVLTQPGTTRSAPAFLPTLRSGIEEQAKQDFEERLLEIWSGTSWLGDYGSGIARDRLSQGDMSMFGNFMRRGQEVENDVVAARPVDGSRRVYTVLGDPSLAQDPSQNLRFSPLGSLFDHEEGWVPLASSHAYGPNASLVEHAGESQQAGDMAWFTTDHNEARYMQQRLLRYKPDSNLRIGYTDVPEDVFKNGQAAARSEGSAGLHPLAKASQSNQVWIPKEWRGKYQALSDEGNLVEPPVRQGFVRLYRSGDEEFSPRKVDGEHWATTQEPGGTVHHVDIPYDNLGSLNHLPDTNTFAVPPKLDRAAKPLDTALSTGVDQNQAFAEWGHTASRRIGQVFGGNGQFDETLADVIHNAVEGDLRLDHLWPLKTTQLPEQSVGPQIMVADKQPWVHKLYRWGFDKITQAGDAMTRSPMFLHNYTKVNEAVREVVTNQLGQAGANEAIKATAEHLGSSPGAIMSAWYSLPRDVREAVNPLEAAVARDPIPANLRLLQDHADFQRIGNAAEALFKNKDPELLNEIRDEIVLSGQGIRGALPSIVEDEAGRLPSLDDLTNSYLGLPEKMRTNLLNNGMPEVFPKELAGKTPLSADQWSSFRDAVETNKHIEDTIHQISTQRAIKDTIPYIHDHHLRSQFQEHAKNFIPFWFAQENFIGRVGNLVMRDPAVIRKAQLGLHGLQTFGAITKDQFGEDVFNIPATGALMRVIQSAANVFGNYSIPIVDPMSGQVKHALPGLNELTNVAPSFSPVVTLPLQGLTRLFPELQSVSDFVSGKQGNPKAGTITPLEEVMKPLIPTWAFNTYRGLMHNPDNDQAMASTAIQTAQRMESAGLGISEKDAASMDTPSEVFQSYIDRLKNHTRLATLVKGLVGFISPVSPDITPEDNGLSEDFQKLLKDMPLDDALTVYMQQHPDGAPYTVMKTKVTSGAPLPSSPEALSVMEQSPDFFKKYPNAGAWFLPQSSSTNEFSQAAYNQQLAMNLRVNKSLTDWYKDYYFASAAKDYFDTENGYNSRVAAAGNNPSLKKQMKDQYDTWKADYFNQHPVFAEEIQSPEGKQRRARIIGEMTTAVSDPNAPDVLHKSAMADMVDTYNGMKNRLGQFTRGTNADQQMRLAIKDQFHAWATIYAADHPEVNAFYQRVIQPEVGI